MEKLDVEDESSRQGLVEVAMEVFFRLLKNGMALNGNGNGNGEKDGQDR